MSDQRIGTCTVSLTPLTLPYAPDRARRGDPSRVADERPRVVGGGALVAGQVRREGGERVGNRLPLAAAVDQRQCEEGADGVVEPVGGAGQLGLEELDAGAELTQVPQRAGQLDDRAPAAFTAEAPLERLTVERDGEVGVPSRVAGGRALERSRSLLVGELSGEFVD